MVRGYPFRPDGDMVEALGPSRHAAAARFAPPAPVERR
jgi:hypothetical protein